MPKQTNTTTKIIASLKGLSKHLQPDEQPLIAEPAIWDSGQGQHSTACDVVLTNQRLFGYYFITFPRERLFLDAINLLHITSVSLRKKSYEPLFRELLIHTDERKIYIRASRQKIEALYSALRSAMAQYAPTSGATFQEIAPDGDTSTSTDAAPVYKRENIRRSFDNSPLAITLLFIGGLVLEIGGVILWGQTHSASTGLPLCAAGFFAVIVATLIRRQNRRQQ